MLNAPRRLVQRIDNSKAVVATRSEELRSEPAIAVAKYQEAKETRCETNSLAEKFVSDVAAHQKVAAEFGKIMAWLMNAEGIEGIEDV